MPTSVGTSIAQAASDGSEDEQFTIIRVDFDGTQCNIEASHIIDLVTLFASSLPCRVTLCRGRRLSPRCKNSKHEQSSAAS